MNLNSIIPVSDINKYIISSFLTLDEFLNLKKYNSSFTIKGYFQGQGIKYQDMYIHLDKLFQHNTQDNILEIIKEFHSEKKHRYDTIMAGLCCKYGYLKVILYLISKKYITYVDIFIAKENNQYNFINHITRLGLSPIKN